MNILAEAVTLKFLILYLFIGSALYVHFRGTVRHRFARQLSDHSTFLAPFNVFMYAFSAVPNKPILETADVPELQVLRDNWEVFRDEARSLMTEGEIKAAERYDDLGFNSFFRRGWKRFYLKWYGDDLPSAQELCPRTTAILNRVPQVKAAMFALLPPGGRLVQHRDPFAGSLRYHLGLITPNDDRCRIYVDGQAYSWRDGGDILFDETYIHWAVNEAGSTRVILFADIERPMRYRWAAAVNRFLARTLAPATATRNREGDGVGWANRIFKYLYWVRLQGKALKRYNRRLYYAVKYTIGIAIVALIFA